MKKEDIDEIKFLHKLADAKVYQLLEFHNDAICKEICDDAVKTYDKIIKILNKYIRDNVCV